MLDVLRRRAEKAGVASSIKTHRCEQDRLGIDVQADFALAFMITHEAPDQRRLLGKIRVWPKPSGKLLVAEPKIHVPGRAFQQTVPVFRFGWHVSPQEPAVVPAQFGGDFV